MASNPGDGTGALEKAIDVLDAIGLRPGGLSHMEISAAVGLPRTTTYRLLATLVLRGLVRHDPVKKVYCLGSRCLDFAKQVYTMPELVMAAGDELRELRDLTNETAYVGALEGSHIVSLERFDGGHSLRSNTAVGFRKSVYATSQGKAVLAAMDGSSRDAVMKNVSMRKFTPMTLSDRRALSTELQAIRMRGYAIDDEEIVSGVRCVGAAVIDQDGVVRGAISVAGPAFRLSRTRLELLGPQIAESARYIGSRLSPLKTLPADGCRVAEASTMALYGASPRWCTRRNRLVWIDALGPTLRTYRPGGPEEILHLEQPVTGVLPRQDHLLLTHQNGALRVDDHGVHPHWEWRNLEIVSLEAGEGDDIWVAVESVNGALIGQLDAGGNFKVTWSIPEPVTCIRWNAWTKQLYATAPESGAIFILRPGVSSVKRLASVPKASGSITALEFDKEGGLWAALRDGWNVIHLREDGSCDRSVALPVPYPTGLCLGGEDLDRLFITTARHPVPLDTLKRAPLSGHLFELGL
ncbi:IclR family transcriptional regulator C-terminal domain-containing protein [Herbaspirillum sp. NPDC087042]|uniref:IclR family transcriptional regulator domain-containing protein n=1 Tax=Herbaspirillum sp. NPDC087042 TaxID=3364004 RepID=UPI003822C0CF